MKTKRVLFKSISHFSQNIQCKFRNTEEIHELLTDQVYDKVYPHYVLVYLRRLKFNPKCDVSEYIIVIHVLRHTIGNGNFQNV